MIAAGIGTVRRVVSTTLPTRWGVFRAVGFERLREDRSRRTESALAVILGDVSQDTPLLRVHSQCVTGEVLGSLRCDCREQLEIAMAAIASEGRGLVIYEYQEGRGIGLTAKLQAYALQDGGLDRPECMLVATDPIVAGVGVTRCVRHRTSLVVVPHQGECVTHPRLLGLQIGKRMRGR